MPLTNVLKAFNVFTISSYRQLVCDTPQGCASGHFLMDNYMGILQLGYSSDSVKTYMGEGN